MVPILFITAGIIAYIITRTFKAPIPQNNWKLFNAPGAVNLDADIYKKLEGVYLIKEGDEVGKQVVVKSSYVKEGDEVMHHLSFFFENTTFFIFRGKKFRNKILLGGYWCYLTNYTTGKARFVVNDIKKMDSDNPIIITGRFGKENNYPTKKMSLIFNRPLLKTDFTILGHRGGSRNVDYLPYSANSLEILKMTSLLGSTGVEIDVNITADKVPVLFHDSILTEQTIHDYFGAEAIASFSLEELKQKRLKKGEEIPTLQEALSTILYCTPLQVVWLDIKFDDDLEGVRALQEEFIQKAKSIGRKLEIFIGIPDEAALNKLKKMSDYKHIPTLLELTPEVAQQVNANVFASFWTEGLESDFIEKMHAEGRQVFAWTVNASEVIKKFILKGNYDGMLSNYPSVVAYHLYTRGVSKTIETISEKEFVKDE